MLDIKFVRNNPDLVKENIKKKFQDHKLPLVDEAIELDTQIRNIKFIGDELRAKRNAASNEIGVLMREKKKEEAMKIKESVVCLKTLTYLCIIKSKQLILWQQERQ